MIEYIEAYKIIFGLLLVLILGCISQANDVNKIKFELVDKQEPVLFMANPININYTQEGWVRINPGNATRFIYLECINSTLKINETMIYCEKEITQTK